MDIIARPSPNCNARRHGGSPDMVVLHYTAMDTAEAALARLCAPEHEVSAHYLIGADGAVWQMVEERDRAWHAGAGAWGEVGDVNSHSIGIELANCGAEPFAAAQMRALERLLAQVLPRWNIPPARVIAHSDLAPGRKSDPGARFDWRALARRGLSVWPGPGSVSGPPPSDFHEAAARFGYRGPPDAVLEAFRLRFRPWARGQALDATDCALIGDLAARHPCRHPALDPASRNTLMP